MSLGVKGLVPGFEYTPGVNADYHSGTCTLEASIAHFTAGAYGGDRAVGLDGYFTGYAPKARKPEQYAFTDCITWAECEWNRRCTSLEVEKRNDSESMDDTQIKSGGLWVAFHVPLGIPMTYYDVPHSLHVGGPLPAGHISHRSLDEVKCDDHYDYWSAREWEAIAREAKRLLDQGEDEQMIYVGYTVEKQAGKPDIVHRWVIEGRVRVEVSKETADTYVFIAAKEPEKVTNLGAIPPFIMDSTGVLL